MDINVLVLNVGNTRVAVGAFRAGELVLAERAMLSDRDAVGKVLGEAWTRLGDAKASVAAASVNPPAEGIIHQRVLEITGQNIEWVGRDLDIPIKNLTQNPAETGVDRLLNVAAAFEQFKRACVVIDMGTAITIDACNDEGAFEGGAIAPGLRMMLDALHEKTAKLPRVEFAIPPTPFGRNTTEAIQQGVYHGVRGLIKEVVENYATAFGFWPEVIATGGDAQQVLGNWDVVNGISNDLTLYGIALAYADHYIKHEN